MTILSIVCTKLLCTNAHLGRRVADHHFKVYIRGSRNGIAILDSDKTLICLRNALHFIGSLSRQKGRFFFLKTNHLFYLEIMEEMVSYLRNVNSHCFDDSQWKIGAFLTNSFANKKKFRSRKKKINFGLNQQPDCVVILNADRKSSVILEADRSQIPILSLVDSTIPWESYKRITYPIPANDSIQFVYLFCHLIMKTVILEQNAISRETPSLRVTLSTGRKGGIRTYSSDSSSPKGRNRSTFFKNAWERRRTIIVSPTMNTLPGTRSFSTSSPKGGKNLPSAYLFFVIFTVVVATAFIFFFLVDPSCSWIAPDQARELIMEWILSLSQSVYHILQALFAEMRETWSGRERYAPLGGTELLANPSPSRSEEETAQAAHVSMMDADPDTGRVPRQPQPQEGLRDARPLPLAQNNSNQPAPSASSSSAFKENTSSMDRLLSVLGETSVSTGEPSINQLERDFEKEHLEEQRNLYQSAIRTEILKQYKEDVGKRNFSMNLAFFVYNVFNQRRIESYIDSLCDDLEIDEYPLSDLEQFLLDIRGNPKILQDLFLHKWT